MIQLMLGLNGCIVIERVGSRILRDPIFLFIYCFLLEDYFICEIECCDEFRVSYSFYE